MLPRGRIFNPLSIFTLILYLSCVSCIYNQIELSLFINHSFSHFSMRNKITCISHFMVNFVNPVMCNTFYRIFSTQEKIKTTVIHVAYTNNMFEFPCKYIFN